MEDWIKNPKLVIAALVLAVAGGIVDLAMGISPRARPLAYTSIDGKQERDERIAGDREIEAECTVSNARIWGWIDSHEDFKEAAQLQLEHRLTELEGRVRFVEYTTGIGVRP